METVDTNILLGKQNKVKGSSFLIVDDEDTVLRSIGRELKELDVTVAMKSCAEEALKELEQREFTGVISDLRMPGTDGIAFLEKVKKRFPEVVRILISGKADFDSAVDAINRVGLFSFISKPWDSATLKETLSPRAVEFFEMSRENEALTSKLNDKCSELGFMTTNLEKEVQSRTTSMLLGMVNALDLRDTETHWHSRRVALFSNRLAVQIGIEGHPLLEIERGALLHDVGKIGVSDTILLKPGKLTEEEWAEMRRHSEYGYKILENVEFLGDARKLVWQHHERWDGKGYPNGLSGEEIYIGARIFAVIDTYDAMTSDRPYRKALPHHVACEEINKGSGSQFDPSVVKAWNEIAEEELMRLRELAFSPTGGLS